MQLTARRVMIDDHLQQDTRPSLVAADFRDRPLNPGGEHTRQGPVDIDEIVNPPHLIFCGKTQSNVIIHSYLANGLTRVGLAHEQQSLPGRWLTMDGANQRAYDAAVAAQKGRIPLHSV